MFIKFLVPFLFLSISCAEYVSDIESDNEPFNVLCIPGQSGVGSEDWYVKMVLGDTVRTTPLEKTYYTDDLGQGFCLRQLRKTMMVHKDKQFMIYATCQGTATAINYLALEDKGKQIKGLVLESMMISGNRAIQHWADKNGPSFKDLVSYLPKFVSPDIFEYILEFGYSLMLYWPAGKQPIKLIKQIPLDIPIIIIHSEKDTLTTYEDACAFYQALKAQGNTVYLITTNVFDHIRLLKHETEEKKIALKSILKKHNLLKHVNDVNDKLDAYCPQLPEYNTLYNDILLKEKKIEKLTYIYIALYACIIARVVLYYAF